MAEADLTEFDDLLYGEGGGPPMARKKSLRSQLYRAARDMGNVEAVKDGGVKGLAKRDARRAAYRRTNSATGSFLRALGLSGTRRKR